MVEGRARRRCCPAGQGGAREHDHDLWAIPADPVPAPEQLPQEVEGEAARKRPRFERPKSVWSPSAAPKRHGVGRDGPTRATRHSLSLSHILHASRALP